MFLECKDHFLKNYVSSCLDTKFFVHILFMVTFITSSILYCLRVYYGHYILKNHLVMKFPQKSTSLKKITCHDCIVALTFITMVRLGYAGL